MENYENNLIEKIRLTNSIAVIGEAMVELSDNIDQLKFAGDSLNTAIYLKRELHNKKNTVAFFSALGNDLNSEKMIKFIESEGLTTNFIERRVNSGPGKYKIVTDKKGERNFHYWRDESAARTLFSKPCAVKFQNLLEFDLVYITGISIAILPRKIQENLLHFFSEFKQKGGLIAFDSNYRKTLWKSKKAARIMIKKYWQIADIALPSLDDEKDIFDLNTQDDVVNNLKQLGVKFGALKRGSKGPYSLTDNSNSFKYTIVTNTKDTTAAGDSFNGAYLASLINGSSQDISIIKGHKLASRVIQNFGAII
tara:strand:- start:1374 stop:2300 length:927 start_codon:yes stop_codon:yes gene_type:complete